MTSRDGEAIRKSALPWYGKTVVDTYLQSRGHRYGFDFLELIFEGYQAYINGSIRSSMIVTGEALLRILYARIAEVLQRGSIIVRHGKRTITVRPASLHDLQDELTFFQAQKALSHYMHKRIYQEVDAVRFLRNRAAHGDMPTLDEWDPDQQEFRSAEDFYKLFNDEISFAEGYRFYKEGTWVTFAIRDHPCNTLHELSTDEKLAVIQQLFVISVAQELFPSEWPGNPTSDT